MSADRQAIEASLRHRRRVCAAATVAAASTTAAAAAMATERKPSALSNRIHKPNFRISGLAKKCSSCSGRRRCSSVPAAIARASAKTMPAVPAIHTGPVVIAGQRHRRQRRLVAHFGEDERRPHSEQRAPTATPINTTHDRQRSALVMVTSWDLSPSPATKTTARLTNAAVGIDGDLAAPVRRPGYSPACRLDDSGLLRFAIRRFDGQTDPSEFPYAASSIARIAVSGWLIGSTPTRLTMDVMVPSASASTQAARCSNPR